MVDRFSIPEDNLEGGLALIEAICADENNRTLVAIWPAGRVESRTFTPKQRMSMRRWIEERGGQANLHFHVNALTDVASNRKAGKEDIEYGLSLHVDIDDPAGGEALRAFRPAPSAIVFSGYGWHGYWFLKERTRELERLESVNRYLEGVLGGDHCHNRDRVMRIPGTINLPNAKKARLGRAPSLSHLTELDVSRRYSLDDFPSDPGYAGPKGAVSAAPILSQASIDQLPATVGQHTLDLIEYGDDPKRPRGTSDARYPSRSEAVYRAVCDLLRAGVSKELTVGILLNPSYSISQSVLEKRNPQTYAWRQVSSAELAISETWPDITKTGVPRPSLQNALAALLRLGLTFGYDRFRSRKIVNGKALQEYQGQISDDAVAFLRGEILSRFGFDPLAEHVRDAVNQLCLYNPFHPVLDEIDAFQWDEVCRVETWLIRYLGADDTPLNRAIGKIVLVAALRRLRQPGVKFDEILILEGKQGSGKSSALRILAGPGLHSDQEILTQDSKTQMELLEGVWIYELGEVEGFSRAEVNKIKAFASRQEERSRPAYGRFVEIRPRQVVFVGTTNETTYLRDTTGNRRFWPVKTTVIDLEALRHDRDQLWAEASALESSGETISLPKELWEAAAAQQAERLEEDPWTEALSKLRGKAYGDVVRIETSALMMKVGVPPERQNQHHTKRIAPIMRHLGWESTKFRVAGSIVRGYERAKPDDHQDDVEF